MTLCALVLLVAASETRQDFETVFQHGLELAQSGRELEAVEQFRKAHRLAPESAVVLYNLGSLLDRLGQSAQAIDAFQKAAALSPGERSIQLALGEALYQAGHTTESIAPLDAAARGELPPPEALVLLAKAYEAESDFSKSVDTLARYLELRPDDLEARILLGEQLAAQKRYDEAVAIWRGGAPVPEVHYRIGEALSRSPATAAEAESSLREALALDPSHLRASLVLARLLARAQRAEEGLAVLLAASERSSDSADVSFVLANLYRQLGQVENSEAARARFQLLATEAEQKEQHDARVHVTYKRARQLLDEGKIREAEKEFRAVVELDPKNAVARSMLAKIAFSRGELAEARRWIEESLSLDPSEGEFHYLQGLFAAGVGEGPEAERSVRRSLELLPGFTDAWLLLGVLLTDSGRPVESVDCFEKAAALDPTNPTVYLNLATSYEKIGRSESAAEALGRYRELTEKR